MVQSFMRSLRLPRGGRLSIFTSIQYSSLLFSACVRNLDLWVHIVIKVSKSAGAKGVGSCTRCTRANAFPAVMSQVTIFKIAILGLKIVYTFLHTTVLSSSMGYICKCKHLFGLFATHSLTNSRQNNNI